MLTRTPDHPTAEIVGWGSFQSFYGYSAYDATAKISWCLAEAFRGQGRGKSPVAHGLARAPGLGIRTLPGYLSARNEPRLRLFRACGVAGLAHLPNIARLDGTDRSPGVVGKQGPDPTAMAASGPTARPRPA